MPALCPLCALDEYTAIQKTEDGIKYVVCSNLGHGTDGFVWEPTPPPGGSQRGDGLGVELGIWDKLLDCVPVDKDFMPYGAIEDELFTRYPEEATVLLHRYGHRWKDPKHRSGQYSMSAYLASRLRELEKEKHLELKWGPAEGPWAYNETISWWRKP